MIKKRKWFPIFSKETAEPLVTDLPAGESWENQMANLAERLTAVRWRRHQLTVRRSKRIRNRVNVIREQIEEMSSDLITLIPSARWLIDNFQMIYREVKKLNFSTSGEGAMPVLKNTPWQGLPRIYVIAKTMVDLTGGFLNEDNILILIKAYQRTHPLTDRELQLLPEMLGLCLLEHILGITGDILSVADFKVKAEAFVGDRYQYDQDYPDISPLMTLEDKANDVVYFHSHVLYQLKSLSVDQDTIQRYLSAHFKEEADIITSTDVFMEESRQESLLESAIRNPLASLRELGELDEDILFDELSALDEKLQEDPDGVYPQMDSGSRAMYRDVVEKLSIKTGLEEMHIAEACLQLARAGHAGLHSPHHVGTYLVGKGIPLLKGSLKGKKPPAQVTEPANLKGLAYFLAMGAVTVGLLYVLFLIIRVAGYGGAWGKMALYLLAALPITLGIALRIVNSLFTRTVPTRGLPAMNYTEGIPQEARTLVVMPVIISNAQQGLEYLNRLHKHYLANRQDNLYFALLADYADAAHKDMPEDKVIRDALVKRLHELNAKRPSPTPLFSLLFRERLWNPSENRFMCWERKRGKLEEFNKLLNGESVENTSFNEVIAPEGLLPSIRYVITLDADSDLVMDSASLLVGIIHHPLNRAVIDPEKKAITHGYAIIQPQVMNHILEPQHSVFQQVYTGKTGLPNYSMAISDIYQDVFQAGIFVGKGIYNVSAFHRLLHGAIPENRILSHDLLESCYARTGFGSRAQVVESFPGTFVSYSKRQHRWIRGDWQLLPWLFKKEMAPLSKWKMLDNMRSSLVPAFKVMLLFFTLWFYPGLWWLWLTVQAAPLAMDLLDMLAEMISHWVQGRRYVLLYRKLIQQLALVFSRAHFDLVFLPFEAYYALDAIVRTIYRYLVSKKHFLLWEPADHVDRTQENTLVGYLAHMWPAIPVGAGMGLLALGGGLPVLGTVVYLWVALWWALSFHVAYTISRVSGAKMQRDRGHRGDMLWDTARRTWRFFRDFSIPEHHRLCPDNYQLGRLDKVMAKTSPTNIGLQLLSALSAWDLGFETPGAALRYIEGVLDTVERLPKWEGHLYNWYDTRTLQVLNPRYVSTVDSGNFSGYMVTLKKGLMDMTGLPVVSTAALEELAALLTILGADVQLAGPQATYGDLADSLTAALGGLERLHTADAIEVRDFSRLSRLVVEDIEKYHLRERPMAQRTTLLDLQAEGVREADVALERIQRRVDQTERLVSQANFSRLFNKRRKLFSIGYNESSNTFDRSCYDLIASEALLASLLAIAKGDVPADHWKRLGRPLTIVKGRPAHVSWSGTMFEYLMPQLVIKEYAGSVFEDSSQAAVTQQKLYAHQFSIPWGISESQYYRFDTNQNYQYRAFGVPKLRLQPVYKDMQIISPYSTMLALEYAGPGAIENLQRLKDHGAYGEYGFYEAVDFTLPDAITLRDYNIVKSFMAHHQGMSLVATNNYVNQGIMRKRFHQSPMIKAVQPLLEEKHQSLFAPPSRRSYTINFKKRDVPADEGNSIRHIRSLNLPVPATNYFSNGDYSLLVTSDGDGFSRWRNTMLYRWRPDGFSDTGLYVYIKDTSLNAFWSAAHHPTQVQSDSYHADLYPHQAVFNRRDKGIATTMLVTMMPDAPIEIRQIRLKNTSTRPRNLEVTSFLETALDSFQAESSHPAFNKLFVDNEYLPQQRLFISKRRGAGDQGPYGMMMMLTDTHLTREVEYESSRMRFVGRNNTLQNPQAMGKGARLSNSVAFSPDPIMSIRAAFALMPGDEAEVTYLCGVFESRQAVLEAAQTYSAAHLVEDAALRFEQQSRIELRYLDISGRQLRAFHNIIRQLYYPTGYYRGPVENIRRNWTGQSGLWKFGISGDNPIMLVYVKRSDAVGLVQDVLKIYEYMGINGVAADLVILAESSYGYSNDLNAMLSNMTSSLRIYDSVRERSGIYIIHTYELSPMETDLIYTTASVVFTEDTGIYFRRSANKR